MFTSSSSHSHPLSSLSPFEAHHLKSVCTTVESSPCANSSAWSECDQAENSCVDGDEDNNEQIDNAQIADKNDGSTNDIINNNSHIL